MRQISSNRSHPAPLILLGLATALWIFSASPLLAEEWGGTNAPEKSQGYKSLIEASARGIKLWSDPTLGTTGFTCLSGGCHGEYENLGFENNQLFPHYVEMTKRVVTLTQMINYCLVNPMAGKALKSDSDEMTAMSAFYRSYRIQYRNRKSRGK